MSKLETVLWKLYIQGDPRIQVVESFQKEPHTYVKVIINDGKHDIVIQEIATYPFAFRGHEKDALKAAVHNALKKAADLITDSAPAPVIKELSGGSFYSGFWQTRDPV